MDRELADFLRRRAEAEKQADPNHVHIDGKGTNVANRTLKPEGTRKCPICEKLMNSEHEFGIAIDVCDDHGVWLDYGELEALADLRTQITRDVLRRHLESMRKQKQSAWSLLVVDSILGSRRNESF